MKKIIVAAILACSTVAYAAGNEEVCYKSAETQAKFHKAIKGNPDIDYWMKLVDETPGSESVRKGVREKVYYSFNRLVLSPEDIRKLYFNRCIVEIN
jgi:hypothetical protein